MRAASWLATAAAAETLFTWDSLSQWKTSLSLHNREQEQLETRKRALEQHVPAAEGETNIDPREAGIDGKKQTSLKVKKKTLDGSETGVGSMPHPKNGELF